MQTLQVEQLRHQVIAAVPVDRPGSHLPALHQFFRGLRFQVVNHPSSEVVLGLFGDGNPGLAEVVGDLFEHLLPLGTVYAAGQFAEKLDFKRK